MTKQWIVKRWGILVYFVFILDVIITKVLLQFQEILSNYFEEGGFEEGGVPQIEEIVEKMNMSCRYLSDSLKSETGKSAIDHLHLYLMDEAKNLLLEPKITVSEAAYKLGFEYPNYFSRLFKKKVGMSPKEYQNQNPLKTS